MRILLIIALIFLCILTDCEAQIPAGQDTIPYGEAAAGFVITGRSKRFDIIYLVVPAQKHPVQTMTAEKVNAYSLPAATNRKSLLKITGNILYDINYRSRIDTPYAEKDVYQHTLQTRLDIVYKEQYPFRVYLTTRFSNSSLFREYTDLNFQYSASEFKRMLKQKVSRAVDAYIAEKTGETDSLKKVIAAKRSAIGELSQSLQAPDLSQKLVEEREKIIAGKPKISAPGTHTDTTNSNLSQYQSYKDSIEHKKEKLDSLSADLEAAEKLYKKLLSTREFNLSELKKQIESATDVNALVKKLHLLNIPDTILPKGYKTLSAIQSFSIGRSTADYSELSVKNISITGLQVEYNPGYYYAVAVGKVDYRFRDYIVPAHPRSHQYVALARFGKGTRNGNHVIFTYYTGRRQFFNSSIASQATGTIPEYNLAGLTMEGFYKVNRNISIIGEIAKSTIPYYSLDSLQRKGWTNSITKFSDRSNEAYALKLFSYFPKTQTRFTGNIRYTGANFQSFSTFTSGASQLRWMTKLEQPFFKKQLTFISSLQQNDYNNPFISTAYKSSSLLASFQANLRIKKWPVISLGYYPSYQLIKTGDDQYSESRYYTLSGSAGYYYNINQAQLSSFLVYSRFYNEAGDSGFVYYNSKNILLSQQIMLNRFSLMANASLSTSTDYNLYTIENSGQFTVNRYVTAGAGVKMIKYSLLPAMQWGYSGSLTLKIPKLGDIQLSMDKGFIPGINRQLAENRIGRLTYYKTF